MSQRSRSGNDQTQLKSAILTVLSSNARVVTTRKPPELRETGRSMAKPGRRLSSFVCLGCGQTIQRKPFPARDCRTHYCCLACKMRVFTERSSEKRQVICASCGCLFTGYQKQYCSVKCRLTALAAHGLKRRQAAKTRTCCNCGTEFKSSIARLCSQTCRRAWQGKQLKGRPKPQPGINIECIRCRKAFVAKQKQVTMCRRCIRAVSPSRDHGKPRQKSRRFGVPYESGILPEQVFARDSWCCQLCGCRTPKRLRGKHKPNSPEVDHIVPFAAGGGHVWYNVQTSCRKCNILKSAKPLGQLRLVI